MHTKGSTHRIEGQVAPDQNSRGRRRQRGSTFVESGLIFLVFAFMMVGAFDFGQFLFVQQALVDRARFAARWGAVGIVNGTISPNDTSPIQNMVLYNQSATPTDGRSGIFNLTTANVPLPTTPGSGTDDYRLVVGISGYQYNYAILGHFLSTNGPAISVSVPLGN